MFRARDIFPVVAASCVIAMTLACPVPADDGTDGGRPDTGEGEGEGEGEQEPATGCTFDNDTGYQAPVSTRTARVGSDSTLDIATWNIRNFPRFASTPGLAADIITSLDLDLIAIEEVEDSAAFDQLRARLPEHDGVLSTDTYSDGSYQKLAFLYRCGVLAPVGTARLPFASDGGDFPRPPLQQTFRYFRADGTTFDFVAIAVHFKASEGNNDTESSARRASAFTKLQNYVSTLPDSQPKEVVILGDFNERLDEADGAANWAPFLDATKYVVRSKPLSDRGEFTYLSDLEAMLDHIVTTRAFDDEVGNGVAFVPEIENDVSDYRNLVSDHRPITLVMRGVE
jgi:exonuclease III